MKLWRLLVLPGYALSEAGYMWICISAALLEVSAGPPVSLDEVEILALAIGWSAFFVAVLWLGQRDWHAFQRRPHPFLAD